MCANVHCRDAGTRILDARLSYLQPCRERSLISFKQSAGENRLVATLTGSDQRLFADFERVELHSAEAICRSGERMRHVYFPTDGIISLLTSLPDGSSLEVGSIGHEGMLGSSLVLGVSTSAQHHVTQESLAHMLGVRRVGITNAANSLREQGLIDYRRGVVTILDGNALELASCACYGAANDMYERAFGSFSAHGSRRRGRRSCIVTEACD